MKKIQLITDGACINNPGPGGWACILRYKETARELVGGEPETTNNRMELRALLEGLLALKEPCEVVVVTDSKYVLQGMTEWLPKWKVRGWKTKGKKSGGTGLVLNQDLWLALDEAVGRHTATFEWVKGHANHPDNIRCDRLATKAAKEIASQAKVS